MPWPPYISIKQQRTLGKLGSLIGRLGNNDKHYRVNCFLHMLQKMPEGAFHRTAVERYAQPILMRMTASAVPLTQQMDVPELIPLETLWQLFLACLPFKRIKCKPITKIRSKQKPPRQVSFTSNLIYVGELSRVLSRKMLMRLTVLGTNPERKLDKLYCLLVEQPEITEDDAKEIIYPKGNAEIAFTKLKTKLKERLRDVLLFTNKNKPLEGETRLAYQRISRLLALSVIMTRKEAWITGFKYAKHALNLALEFEHIDHTLEAARHLGRIAVHLNDSETYLQCQSILLQHLELSDIENEVEWRNSKLVVLNSRSLSNHPEIKQLSMKYLCETQHLKERFPHFGIQRFTRTIECKAMIYNGLYNEAKYACDDAIAYFSQKPFKILNTIKIFTLFKLEACTRTKDYERGKAALQAIHDSALLEQSVTTSNLGYIYSVIFHLYCRRYQEAYEYAIHFYSSILHMGESNDIIVEYAYILKAYVQLLKDAALVITDDNDSIGQFRHGRFSNEINIFGKDKDGLNIAIRIVRFASWIIQGKHEEAFDHIEALEKYMYRHVPHERNYRAHFFIKMMLQIPISGFQVDLARQLAQPYLDKLAQMPIHKADYSLEIEIIPFEDLWDILLDVL
ncbi:MAG: hypothetical protein R2795_13690 [Saprospiraceae bacterium]